MIIAFALMLMLAIMNWLRRWWCSKVFSIVEDSFENHTVTTHAIRFFFFFYYFILISLLLLSFGQFLCTGFARALSHSSHWFFDFLVSVAFSLSFAILSRVFGANSLTFVTSLIFSLLCHAQDIRSKVQNLRCTSHIHTWSQLTTMMMPQKKQGQKKRTHRWFDIEFTVWAKCPLLLDHKRVLSHPVTRILVMISLLCHWTTLNSNVCFFSLFRTVFFVCSFLKLENQSSFGYSKYFHVFFFFLFFGL